jgi:hypothetical protein
MNANLRFKIFPTHYKPAKHHQLAVGAVQRRDIKDLESIRIRENKPEAKNRGFGAGT